MREHVCLILQAEMYLSKLLHVAGSGSGLNHPQAQEALPLFFSLSL